MRSVGLQTCAAIRTNRAALESYATTALRLSVLFSLLLAAGCLFSGLTPAQALWACTFGAARALHLADRGALATGLRADIVLHATREPAHLPYHAGVDHARFVLRRGQVILDLRHDPLLNCA